MKHRLLKKGLGLAAAFSILISVCAEAAPMVNYKLTYDGAAHNYSAQEVYIELNGTTLEQGDMPPVILDGRTYVPARAVFEAMGAEVAWNEDTKEVYIIKDNNVVVLKIDSKTGNKNGQAFEMDVAAKIINDRTMIPVRAVSEAFGCQVSWDDSARKVVINENAAPAPETPDNDSEAEPETPPVVTPDPGANSGSNSNSSSNSGAGSGTVQSPEITVTAINTPGNTSDSHIFSITASGEIASYTSELISNNRLVIDINNATMGVAGSSVNVGASPYVGSVRISQFQTEPVKIARVVLDLTGNLDNYHISQSGDKKSIVVSFTKNTVTNVSVTPGASADVIKINGKYKLSGRVSTLSNPDRVVIDLPYSSAELANYLPSGGFSVIKSISIQEADGSTKITMEVPWGAETSSSENGTEMTVTVAKSTLQNLSFDSQTNRLTLKKITPVNIAGIAHNDDYMNLKYTITLPGNYEGSYGIGSRSINNNYLEKITLGKNGNGFTTITFDEVSIIACKVTEDNENVYIDVKNPREVYDRIVVLDAGHGGSDPGTSGNGLTEKGLNLEIVQKAYAKLEADNRIKVYVTRLDDSRPDNNDRARMANQIADLFVSVHMNSANTNTAKNPIPNGTETLYKVHSTDVEGKLTSRIAATVMQEHMLNALQTNNRGLKVRDDLLVLNATTVPAIIVETCFLSNPGDAAKIAQEQYKEAAATAVYEAIVEIMTNYTLR